MNLFSKSVFNQINSRFKVLIINQLSNAISLIILASNISPDNFGLVGTTLIIIQAGWVISDWGIMYYSSEIWSAYKTQKEKNILTSNILGSRFLLSFFFFIIIAFCIFIKIINLPIVFLFFILFSLIFGSCFPMWFFHVNKCPNLLCPITFFYKFLFILFVFNFVNDDSDLILYLFFFTFSIVAITIHSLIIMKKTYFFKWQKFNLIEFMIHFKKSTPFFVNDITNNKIYILWGLAVAFFGTPIAIGFYNIAEKAYRGGAAFSDTISQIIRINTINSQSSKTFKMILFILFIFLIMTAIFVLFYKDIFLMFFSNDYIGALKIINIMIFVWFFHACIRLINYPLLANIISLKKIHSLNPIILFIHLFFILLWYFLSRDVHLIPIYFLVSSIIHLCLLIFLAIKIKK